ncbi:hypothetical protein H0H92_002480 [Tricholoma furcatifolium]|nr:hypothetical protein H0H92_002480 [Tricholoma furcatifolium]
MVFNFLTLKFDSYVDVVSQESKPFVTQLGPDTTFYGFAGPADDSSEKSSLEQLEAFKSAFERMGVMSDTGASTTPSNITSTPTLFSFPKHSNDLAGPSPIVSGLKYKPNEIIRSCHTIPCKDPRRAKDGWAECLLAKEDTLDVIISTPGFPIALEHPPEVRHRLGQSKLGHLGMFATQDLHFGDLILSERPLLVIECSEKIAASLELPPGIAQNMPLHEIQKASLSYWEHNISKVLDRMDPDRQKAYRSLWNSHLHDGSGPLFGIVRTNCFSISLCDDKKQFMAVLDQMSRINHSCMPNVTVTFDPESFSYRLSALRDLKAGEELFATYLNILSTTAARQEKLKPYGFSCTCKACLDPGSDYLRSRIKRNMIIDLDPLGWTFPPIRGQDYEKTLLDSKQWLKTLEDAGT